MVASPAPSSYSGSRAAPPSNSRPWIKISNPRARRNSNLRCNKMEKYPTMKKASWAGTLKKIPTIHSMWTSSTRRGVLNLILTFYRNFPDKRKWMILGMVSVITFLRYGFWFNKHHIAEVLTVCLVHWLPPFLPLVHRWWIPNLAWLRPFLPHFLLACSSLDSQWVPSRCQ